MSVTPYSLKDAPALIERVFPSQKVSVESYKEQMANLGKTLTALGSYWKGRKPLVLNKAVILASLLPATDDLEQDLMVFNALMGMDDDAFLRRLPGRSPLREKIAVTPFRELVEVAQRAENVPDLYDGVWPKVNRHLGTSASSMPELIEQLGVMRFGSRPRFADVFSGSGQIPFEAARLGLKTFASDLNPIACMLTWSAFNIVGALPDERAAFEAERNRFVALVREEIATLGFEPEVHGWKPKAYLYCVEVRCPESGWLVPLMPSRVVSRDANVVAELIPEPLEKRYRIEIRSGVTDATIAEAANSGTVQTEGNKPMLVHSVDGVTHRTRIEALRDGTVGVLGPLRPWDAMDIAPRAGDVFQERLYMVQWTNGTRGAEGTEYRSVTPEDEELDRRVQAYVTEHREEWQRMGFIPDMRIEPGTETDRLLRERGWTHWHHLFNPRQLLLGALMRKHTTARLLPFVLNAIQHSSRLSIWHVGGRGNTGVTHVFTNQALNTLFNYGARATEYLLPVIAKKVATSPLPPGSKACVQAMPADNATVDIDVAVTDPPYGDAVNYEEILEFFIAWVARNPPPEFAHWTWDSRRSLAIKGEGHGFKRSMVEAYANIARHMPDNGIQVLMFTHQSGKIWSDIASIVWGAGLQVTAAWYVTTETSSALRVGAYVKGTVLLVLRKRQGDRETLQDELAFELEQEVKRQVEELVGLNQRVREHSARDENAFNDADLQMAGYAAALRVLTKYRSIDGKDMVVEARRPRAKGEKTVVDSLIDFAVDLANAALVPQGLTEGTWEKLTGVERFYLKMLEQEAHGMSSLDSFQQFAKAFRVREPSAVMASARANQTRLKSSVELGRSEMHETSEFGGATLRAVLFAMQQLANGAEREKVLTGLRENVRDYYQARGHVRTLAQFLHQTLRDVRPEEAEHARLVDLFVMSEGV